MLRRMVVTSVLAGIASGCASVATWTASDPALANFLQDRRTHCDVLPRTYSGFHFDFCWLDSDPQRIYGSAPMILLLGDGALSAIADTFALPVTLVRQRQRGDIPLRARPVMDSIPEPSP
jgi:uncharacterized protein YceK